MCKACVERTPVSRSKRKGRRVESATTDELANAAVLPRFLEGYQDWLETYPVRPFRRYLHFVTLDVVEQGLQATTETHEQVRRGRAKKNEAAKVPHAQERRRDAADERT